MLIQHIKYYLTISVNLKLKNYEQIQSRYITRRRIGSIVQ